MGARGRARDCTGTSRSTSGKNGNASSDSGTSLRHHQVLDGSNALSYEAVAESGSGDGAQCARLQHEARDGDHWRGRAAGSLGSLSQERVTKSTPAVCLSAHLGAQGRFCADWRSVIANRSRPEISAGTEPFSHSLGHKLTSPHGAHGPVRPEGAFRPREPRRRGKGSAEQLI